MQGFRDKLIANCNPLGFQMTLAEVEDSFGDRAVDWDSAGAFGRIAAPAYREMKLIAREEGYDFSQPKVGKDFILVVPVPGVPG